MSKPTITFGSLFSGIGGLDLGFERAGFEVKWQVENNDYCTKVLAKHWPDVARHGDVRSVGKHNLEPVDCIIGGFPCQPHSQAGKRKASSDERDLWPEFYRIICELRPRWVVAENVLGLLSSENGAFFGGILRDLAKARYDARWRVLSAAQFGAPHLRERVIVVAHTSDILVRTRSDIPGSMGETTASADSERACSLCGPAACSSASLANASSPKWWQSAEGWRDVTDWTNTGWEEAASGFELCGEELANASSAGRQKLDTTTIAGEQEHAAWRNLAPGTERPVESSTGRRERQHQSARGPQGAQPLTEQSSSWAVESGVGRDFARIPTGVDGDINEERHQDSTNEALPGMWQGIGEEEIQRHAGGLSDIYPAHLLQLNVHGNREDEGNSDSCGIQETSGQTSGYILPEMWCNRESACTSSRQHPREQQSIESHDVVRLLSRQMALAEWEEVAEKTVGVQVLRSACAALGYVPETLSALQEVWQSLSHQNKNWIAVYASGRYPWPAGPGRGQYEWEASRVTTEKVANRTARLKGLGNAVVVALAESVAREISIRNECEVPR